MIRQDDLFSRKDLSGKNSMHKIKITKGKHLSFQVQFEFKT